MALNTTLTQLLTTIRQRADMVSNNYVTDAELTAWINLSGAELYDLLVGAYGNDYQLKSATFTTSAGKDTYDLSSDVSAPDFYKLRGVDLVISSTRALTLKPYQLAERNLYQNQAMLGTLYGPSYTYRLSGNSIVLSPSPTGVQTVRIWYTPVYKYLVSGSDTLDGVDGWEAYIIADVSRMVNIKQDQDASAFSAEKEELKRRINDMAESRDSGEPMRVMDTSQDSLSDFWGNGRWSY